MESEQIYIRDILEMSQFSLNFTNYESLRFSDITQSPYFRTISDNKSTPRILFHLEPDDENQRTFHASLPPRSRENGNGNRILDEILDEIFSWKRERERGTPSLIPPFRSEKREQRILVRRRLTWFFSPTYSLLLSKGLWKPSSSSKQLPLRKTRFSRAFPFGIGKNRGPSPETGNNTRAGSRVNFHLVPRSGRFTFLCAK